jgi:hypothetical protein|tara:strand:- start:323 stop:562 length:240 start_codon:yes stop_codon:yes gene_type:complete
MQQTNVKAFDDWMLWKENRYDLKLPTTSVVKPIKLADSVVAVCTELGLRPTKDYQVSMYEVRFRTKTFLAMFKMNYNNG